jgi:ferritin-like metal-binding protein YciE
MQGCNSDTLNPDMKTLENLFLDALADIYHAEKQLVRAFPSLAGCASRESLHQVLLDHLAQTEGHVRKVEEVFGLMGKAPMAKRCQAIEGLLREAETMADENRGQPTIDAALVAAAQKIEHYEIATYGTLCEWAQQLANDEAVELLEEILEEEKAADARLSQLAREESNLQAEGAESVEVDETYHEGPGSGSSRHQDSENLS